MSALATEAPDFFKESFIGNTGWVVARGTNNPNLGLRVWKTTNFGSNWDSIGRVPYPFTHENYCVFFSSLNTGWCGGTYGHIFKTTNGGYNWLEQVVPSQNFRNSMWFYSDSIGWVAGGGGQILHTTTSGQYVGISKIAEQVPTGLTLYQNYPNPFNGATVIEFEVNENDEYKMEVYDLLGRKVNELFKQQLYRGKYKVNYDAADLSSGIYYYVLSSENKTVSRIMVLAK